MLFLVVFNLSQIIFDKARNREGAKFRFRLTLFFLIITSIPLIPLSIISNNWISKSINLWFVSGIESSLVDAVEVSKTLYERLSMESIREWEEICADCSPESVKDKNFSDIDAVFEFNAEKNGIDMLYSRSGAVAEDMVSIDDENFQVDTWRKVSIRGSEYVIIPGGKGERGSIILAKKIPASVQSRTVSISKGLQNYRTMKIIREPIKGVVFLFYIFVTMPFVLLAFYLSLIVSRDVTNPIRELAIATQKVANDELDYRITFKAKDELKRLIDSFNLMMKELKLNREQLTYTARSSAWQDIARKIAHEIKNPLTPIRLSAERLLRLYQGEDDFKKILSKSIDTILSEVRNINDMVNEFSSFARFPSSKLERQNVIVIMDGIYDFLKETYKGIDFSIHHEEKNVYLFVDKYQLRRAILNIVYNSMNAIDSNGKIRIEGFSSRGKDDHYTMAISDNGAGIEDEIKDQIFSPYFSKNGTGTGLGLAIVEKIVFDCKGRIWFESRPGKTTFFMEFPIA
jgi:nitrogen fixation/metabolism regulation signal transduction histidine kinase